MINSNTGYPSVDKPWLKYYSEEAIKKEPFEGSIYNHILERNKEYMNNYALQYFGRKITYSELFSNVDTVADALTEYDVKKGDNVVVLMTSCPELIYLLLALNKIGAVANLINPLFTKQQIKERINDTDAKVMIVLEQLYELVKYIQEGICIERMVVVPISRSMPSFIRALARIKQRKKINYNSNVIRWNTFVSSAGNRNSNNINDENQPAIMVYSSGTTGASKGIVLTNKGINATISHYEFTGFEYNRTWTYLQIIPTWFSTGAVFCLFMPLSLGLCVIIEPVFSKENFDKDIKRYKPNMIMGATSLWLYFLDNIKKKRIDLSFVKYPITGGEKILADTEEELNDILKKCGCSEQMTTGYGMCELGSTVSATSVKHYKYGSAGYPIKGVTVAAFDINTNKECQYCERGEIRVLSPARMKEYYKQPEATAEFFYKDEDGREWGCTGDVGYVDNDGFLFIEGRATDRYLRENGEVVYLFDIENEILKDDDIDQCKVVDSIINGKTVLVAHIVLKNEDGNADDVLKRIDNNLRASLSEYMVPQYYKIRESMPVHSNGKRDAEALKKDKDNLMKIS